MQSTRRNQLALALAMALSAGGMAVPAVVFAAQAVAEDAPAQHTSSPKQKNSTTKDGSAVTNLVTVVVTGQLESLQQAQATKENAIGVVDSVSALEAGAFPDTNVADALQRVPGVSVDRSGGEANQISVRGFGPTFVNVLVNGRSMPTASPDRAFDFDVLPADLIQKATVYKTSLAELPAGGIGGTVNIQTAVPSDFNGYHLNVNAGGTYANTSGGSGSHATPRAAFVGGFTNADKTFGWLVSGLYYKRDNLMQAVETDGWAMGLDLSRIAPNLSSVSIPQTVQLDSWPQTYVRKSFTGTMEWNPSDAWHIAANTLYANFQQRGQEYAFASYTEPDDIQSMTVDGNGTALSFQKGPGGLMSNDYIQISAPVNSKNIQNGLHITFTPTDSLQIDMDGSLSKAWDKPDASGYFMVLGTRNIGVSPVFTNNGTGKIGSYSNLVPTTDIDALRAHYFGTAGEAAGNGNISDTLGSLRLDLTKYFDGDVLQNAKFGTMLTNETKREDRWQMPGSVGNGFGAEEYNGYVATVPADLVGAQVTNFGNLAGNASPGSPQSWVTYDVNKVLQYYASPAAYGQLSDPDAFKAELDANGGGFAAHPNAQTMNNLEERDRAAYAEINFGQDGAALPWALNLGVRYIYTKESASAFIAPLLALQSNPVDPTVVVSTFGEGAPTSDSGSYHYWLPSLNFKLNLTPTLLMRFAASKTLTRPDLSSLALSQNWGFVPPVLTLNEGNINLKPYTSNNIDAGIEWYPSKSSYVTFDVFHKKVSNFTTSITTLQDILGFNFQVTEPINLNAAKVKGAEVSASYQMQGVSRVFDGVGVAVNYTYASSNATVSPAIIATSGRFAIPGMGNSYNASLFYQRFGVQARLAWNWRSHYLSSLANAMGFPETTRSYGQLDFSGSYDINKNVAVYVEATNLNDERISRYQIYQNMNTYAEADGRTWTLGVRAHW